MTQFFNNYILALGFLALLCCNESVQKDQNDSSINPLISNKIDSIGNAMLAEGGVMGFSIAVNQSGKSIYNKSFGFMDSLKQIPVANDTRFTMASISKLVGSTMVMKLIEEGKLSLESSVHDLLPQYTLTNQAKKLKVKHLISNTSGLLDYAIEIDTVFINTGIPPTNKEYYEFFGKHDLLFEPGSSYAYSNSGFKLMALIVEKLTNEEYGKTLERIINKPTGLNFNLMAEAADDPKTSEYFSISDSIYTPEEHWRWLYGDGGVTATAQELAHFAIHWANGSIISKESFDEMSRPISLINGIMTGYGLGVRNGIFADEKILGHTGGNMSTMAMMIYFPDRDLSIVVMDNTDNSPTSSMLILGEVGLAVLEKDMPDLNALEQNEENLDHFIGDYIQYNYVKYSPTLYSIKKYEDESRLYRVREGSQSKGQELYYLGNNEFGYEPYSLDRIAFDLDDKGNAVAYKHYWNGLFKRMGFRKSDE